MLPFRVNNTHEKYTATYQHWCPQSEQFAGGDHLISALREGWRLEEPMVYAEQDWKSGSRPVTIYHFVLINNDEMMILPVINNPYIERYIMENRLTIVFNDKVDVKQSVRV